MSMSENPSAPDPERKPGRPRRTIASLQLNLEAANAGKVWMILPEAARLEPKKYPLPSGGRELQVLAAIYLPPRQNNSGTVYLRRAQKAHKVYMGRTQSHVIRAESKLHNMDTLRTAHLREVQALRGEVRQAIDEVKQQAAEAIASMTDLFALGRKGIERQMRAHLNNEPLPDGETVTAAAFRDCFRMVTQAVKGLGLPSDQREKSREAILEQAAEALDSTRSAIALAPGTDPEETVQ